MTPAPDAERDTAPAIVPDDEEADRIGLGALALLALPAGAATGLVGGLFRLVLEQAGQLFAMLVAWAQAEGMAGFVVLTGCGATATGLAAFLVRRLAPLASGSGIPHVESALRQQSDPAGIALLPVKFVGGTLAIGAGLALGREGPSVQMGASIGTFVARAFRRPPHECRALLAACAGAGLATAFNAPIAGAIFVLEELVQRFEHRTAIAALAASAMAILVARLLIGNEPVFVVPDMEVAPTATLPLFLILGLLLGALAVGYIRTLLATLDLIDRVPGLPVELRAGLIGAAVAALAFAMPGIVGGGEAVTQHMLSAAPAPALAALPLLFALRFVLSIVSYAAATPGGLFAPLLVLGAQIGMFFGGVCGVVFPGLGVQPVGFALVGMAGFFAAVVRAPITGIVLVMEMTTSTAYLQPMLGACFVAMLVAALARTPPVYEALRLRITRKHAKTPHGAR